MDLGPGWPFRCFLCPRGFHLLSLPRLICHGTAGGVPHLLVANRDNSRISEQPLDPGRATEKSLKRHSFDLEPPTVVQSERKPGRVGHAFHHSFTNALFPLPDEFAFKRFALCMGVKPGHKLRDRLLATHRRGSRQEPPTAESWMGVRGHYPPSEGSRSGKDRRRLC